MKKKKKKHNKITLLAKNKLDIKETLLLNALSDFEISQEEFVMIINEKIKYEGIKENIKDIKNRDLDERSNQVTSL